MAKPRSEPVSASRPVLPWRLVAGAFLHFVLPIYLVALVADFLVTRPATAEAMLHRALPFSGEFLAVYTAVAILGSAAAMAIDPLLRANRTRREARDPRVEVRRSESRVLDALRQGQDRFGAAGNEVLNAIRTSRWRHDDSRFQALSRDLGEVVRTSAAAIDSAGSEHRPAMRETAVRGLRGVLAGLRALEQEESHRDRGDAETVTRYVETRYGSDFAGGAN